MQSDPRLANLALRNHAKRSISVDCNSFPSLTRQIMLIPESKLDRIVHTPNEHVPKYCSQRTYQDLLQFRVSMNTQAKVSAYPSTSNRTFPFSTARFASDKEAD